MGYAGVGILGILVGHLLPNGRGDDASTEKNASSAADRRRNGSGDSRPETEQASGTADRWRREAGKASPAQFTDLVYRALEIPDPFERRVALLEILKHADPANSGDLIEGFAKVTLKTGRVHDEWNDALFEIGRKGGVPVMEKWKASGRDGADPTMWTTLYGMAAGDPQSALKWLDGSGNEDLVEKNRLYSAVIAGATLTNPDEGIRMLAALTPDQKVNCVAGFTKNLIQNGGLDQGVDWMLEVRKTSVATEPKFVEAAETEIYNRITGSVLREGGAEEMAGYLSKIHAAGAISTPRLVSSISRIPLNRRFDLFDQLAQSPGVGNSEAVTMALEFTINQASRNNPGAVSQWIESHPTSPLTGRIRGVLDSSKTE